MTDPMDLELVRLFDGDLPPAPPEPHEDTLREYLADRLHQDWMRAPWWRRWWVQVLIAALIGCVLSVAFCALFIGAGA